MEALHMITSLMDGLAFLHGPANLPGGGYKSAVVHRYVEWRGRKGRGEEEWRDDDKLLLASLAHESFSL